MEWYEAVELLSARSRAPLGNRNVTLLVNKFPIFAAPEKALPSSESMPLTLCRREAQFIL